MTLPGIITNITAFGAFVDIGVHQDGLVHLSQMADKFIKDPNEVVKVSQKVMVRVTEVDVNRKRIALTMKSENKPEPRPKQNYNPAPKQSTVNYVKKPREKEAAPETDIAIKLAALKNKFS
jgi:uncharacterized protein